MWIMASLVSAELHQEVYHYSTAVSLHGWCNHELSNRNHSLSMQFLWSSTRKWIIDDAYMTSNVNHGFSMQSSIRKWIIDSTLCAWLELSVFHAESHQEMITS